MAFPALPQPLAMSPSYTQAQTASSWHQPIWRGHKQHIHSCAHCTLARACPGMRCALSFPAAPLRVHRPTSAQDDCHG
eukprot:1561449-Alexandrium_andersonii.AAC.1